MVDHGSNPAGLTTDARGAARSNGLVDMGAVEVANRGPAAAIGLAPAVTTNGATAYTFTVVYNDATGINVSTLDNSDVLVTGTSFTQTASFVSVDINSNGAPARRDLPDYAPRRGLESHDCSAIIL